MFTCTCEGDGGRMGNKGREEGGRGRRGGKEREKEEQNTRKVGRKVLGSHSSLQAVC